MCHLHALKHTGHYRETEQGVGCLMLNPDFSEEDLESVPREDVFTCNMCGQICMYKCWLGRHIASHMAPNTLKRHIQTVKK